VKRNDIIFYWVIMKFKSFSFNRYRSLTVVLWIIMERSHRKKKSPPAPWPRSSSCLSQALHRDIKATFSRAPAAADAYVSTEVRWKDLEKLFSNPADSWLAPVQGMKGERNTLS